MPDALEILREVNPRAVPAEQPPAAANYREADLAGIACQFCSKFTYTGEAEEGVASGYCGQWEALVRGDHVSDAFADSGPPLDEDGNEQWDFADDDREFNEIHFAGTEVSEDAGFVIKEILRTGEWPVIPTQGGIVKKPLRIVRDGSSNPKEGIIALSELVTNFEAGALDHVQIPLSDDSKDHKNITRLNTGYVRSIWIEDKGEGAAVLKAKMEFTEPEVKEKVLRGTYADVSCGIPWKIRSRGQEFGSTLEHVAITNRPFIDGLGPFLAASDEQHEAEVISYGEIAAAQTPDPETKQPDQASEDEPEQEREEAPEVPQLSAQQVIDRANSALVSQLGLSSDYQASDVIGEAVRVTNPLAHTTWTVPFEVAAKEGEEISLSLAATENWVVEEGETHEPPAPGGSPSSSEFSELEQARRLRELRLSQTSTTKRAKESNMPSLSREELAALELSDDARAAIQSVLDENAQLSAQTREAEAERRVDELKGLGLAERPGALKFYRSVFLSDDGGPAVVLSDSDGNEKSRLSALEILDQFIEGIKGSDGKVALSDQALASGHDDPPPATPENEQKPFDDRVAEARESLYGKK